MPLLRYQVNHCTQVGLQLFLMLLLIFVAWAALTPVYEPKPQLINDKLAHLLAYFALAMTTDHAFATTPFSLKKFSLLFIYGIGLEVLQQYVPGRDFSLLDMLANASGLLIYLLIMKSLVQRELTASVKNV